MISSPSARALQFRSAPARRLLPRVAPVLIMLVAALLLVPDEASLFLGPLRLPPARAILILAVPFAVARLFRARSDGALRISDALFAATGVWMMLADIVTEGVARAAAGAGATALEIVGGYFVARAFLTAPGQAVRLAQIISVLIAMTALMAVPDRFAQSYVVHDFVGNVTGFNMPYVHDVRHGALRAAGIMEHPILLGAVCTFGMLLAVATLAGAARALVIACQLAGLFVAISSAPISAAIIGFGCLVYRRMTPGLERRWHILWVTAALAFGIFVAVMPAPFGWLIGHMAMVPSSGYYRMLIWQIGGDDVLQSPLFGLGLNDGWARPSWMPATVDSLWLRFAMSFGIPASILLALSLASACRLPIDRRGAKLSEREQRLGLVLSIILFLYAFLGVTVHFWGITWILLGILAGMRAHLGALAWRRRPDEAVSMRRLVRVSSQ